MGSIYESFSIQNVSTKGPLTLKYILQIAMNRQDAYKILNNAYTFYYLLGLSRVC